MSPARTHYEIASRRPLIFNQPPCARRSFVTILQDLGFAALISTKCGIKVGQQHDPFLDRKPTSTKRGPKTILTYSEIQGSIGFVLSRMKSSSMLWINQQLNNNRCLE
ncbi:hypothetical protein PDIG_34330 [Penicillium digitatum PHI26]|uniref:Uncharacterized protein n=2 Tax=Penicillium digitatum TaxID=36651 RepID=K9GLT0_PEND2|nr:hypothetical protein PDIP_53890 [Penicillium digitatum Pd1]EKV11970.1 hypothetical protein PDIP_53890 [Penicillium digitatum Pd1]EKV14146.1 hypothetical protein PDIG_34330 [Penicillium digitatum PHI26]